MDLNKLLPVGSVVQLQNGKKKIVIIGILPTKMIEEAQITYDYIGVPYPEGFLGFDSVLLFFHSSIEQVIFEGYDNQERKQFLQIVQRAVKNADETGSLNRAQTQKDISV